MSTTDLDKKYKKLTEVEHVLSRPGRYVGSISSHNANVMLLLKDKFKEYNVNYNPGFLKIFDEIISNSVDEHKKNPNLNRIDVTVDKAKGTIAVYDNGGIEVQQHPTHKEWIPYFIFSNLRAGSSFNDDEKREGAGTHGEGATLTNIFSTSFLVETADGKNKYIQEFTDNLHKVSEPKITKSTDRYTKITYLPDYKRFGMDSLNDANFHMIRKRVIDIAACNRKIRLTFNGEKFEFNSFKQYIKLYTDDEIVYEESSKWKIGIGPSSDGFKAISFVNSVDTRDGGTHVDYIINQITDSLRDKLKRKYKYDIKPSEIRKSMTLYLDSTIINNSFNSQTKEKLITEVRDFGSSHTVSDNFMKQVYNSEIVKRILDWMDKKQLADDRAEERKLNKGLSKKKVLKLLDAQKTGDRSQCILGVFEGDSAKNGVDACRNAQLFGAFPIRGKFRNVRELTTAQVVKNEEVVQLMSSIGLRLGEPPNNLRYYKIYLYTDADPDGDGISGLLINFFYKYWPELFERGMVYRIMTPLLIAKKGDKALEFYTAVEFDEWQTKNDVSKWEILYKKGLGSLEDDEYDPIINNPRKVQILADTSSNDTLEVWFGPDSDLRKERILKIEAKN